MDIFDFVKYPLDQLNLIHIWQASPISATGVSPKYERDIPQLISALTVMNNGEMERKKVA